jgi:hypothetical protein
MPNTTLRTQGFGSLLSAVLAAFSAANAVPEKRRVKKKQRQSDVGLHVKTKSNIKKQFSASTGRSF